MRFRERRNWTASAAICACAASAALACNKPDESSPRRDRPAPSAAAKAPTVAPSTVEVASATVPEEPPPPAPEPPSARARGNAPVDIPGLFDDYGFPAHAAVEHLCGGRDFIGGGESRSWDVFVSAEPPERLVAAYKGKLGVRGLTDEDGSTTWKVPSGSDEPQRSLSVVMPGSTGKHRSCAARPSPAVKSIVTLTRR